MSFGKTKKAKSVSKPVFQEFYLPGQKEYIPEFVKGWQEAYTSPGTSPIAKMLQQMTGEAAMRETAQQRRAISGTRGMTAPAKAKAMGKLGEVGVSAMAKVPQDVWGAAKDILTQYAFIPPTVASGTETISKGGGGITAGCCFIFIAGEGELTDIVRRYRDEFYVTRSGTDHVQQGYRWMAGWLVPLMMRFHVIKEIIRLFMTQPLTNYAISHYDGRKQTLPSWMAKQIWPSVWGVIGRIRNA